MDSVSDYHLSNMDSLEFIKRIPDRYVDLIIFDPPYGVSNERIFKRPSTKELSFSFGEWDKLTDAEWRSVIDRHFKEFRRIIKRKGSVYTFGTVETASHIKRIEEDEGFYHKACIIWCKSNPVIQFRKRNYLSSTECVSFAVRDKDNFTFNFISQKEMKNYIFMPIVGPPRIHPTQKPVKLVRHFVRISSNFDDLVLDPMMGSGTAGVAARELGRRFIGIEINDEYFEKASLRIKSTRKGRKPLW